MGDLTPQGGGEGDFLRHGEIVQDQQGGSYIVVKGYIPGRGMGYHLAPLTGQGTTVPYTQWISPRGTWKNDLGQLISVSGTGEIGQSRNIPWDDWTGGGGTAAGRTIFPSEQAENEARARLANAQARLAELEARGDVPMSEYERESLDLERLRAENDLKEAKQRLLYGEYGATARQKMANQQSAREMKFGLREDPFALANAMTGMPMLGGTPTQQFRGELTDFANQPIPPLSINAPIPQMEAALQALGSPQMPMPGNTFGLPGMAEGGIIEMEKGADGAFSMKQSWLVGEGKRGEGIKNKTAEVMTVERGPFGIKSVEITPLAGAAQAGLTPAQERWSYVQQLAPLWRDISPSHVPGHMETANRLARYGYLPRLARVGDRYWIRGPTGEYREISPQYITGALREGFSGLPQASSAITLRDTDELSQVGGGIGRPLSTAGLQDFLYGLSQPNLTGLPGAMSAPITTSEYDLPMPALHKAAGTLARMFANPFATSTSLPPILSAYQNAEIGGEPAGYSEQALRNIVSAYTPQAGAFGRRVGFTGGWM